MSNREQNDIADLELSLAPVGDRFELTLRLTRPGDAADLRRGPFSVSIDTTALRTHEIDPLDYGAALRDALFADPAALTAFTEARVTSLDAGRRLRVRLLLPSELQPLRLETLLDPRSGRPLALESNLLLTRYLDADDFQAVTLRPRGQLRVLVAAAAPSNLVDYGLAPINAPTEIARVRTALQGIATDSLGGDNEHCTLNVLGERLRDGAGYDILYLVAHGVLKDNRPWLYLSGNDGTVAVEGGSKLADLLRNLDERRPRLVILASCASAGDGFADTLAALGPLIARAGVPVVLAMQGQVSIGTVERFAPVFFGELLRDGLADRALAVARLEVRDCADWWVPVLYSRLRYGHLYDPAVDENAHRSSRAFGSLLAGPGQRRGAVSLVLVLVSLFLVMLCNQIILPQQASQTVQPATIEYMTRQSWITYEPLHYDPFSTTTLDLELVRQELQLIKRAGFDGIVTFGANGDLGYIPCMAHDQGLDVLMGIWDPNDRYQMNVAIRSKDCVDGYVVGHNRLDAIENNNESNRTYLNQLARAIRQLRKRTRLPVTTTERIKHYDDDDGNYYVASQLFELSDWIFPDTRPDYKGNPELDAMQVVDWAEMLASSPYRNGKPILLKMIEYPIHGVPWASTTRAKAFFTALLDDPLENKNRLPNGVSIVVNSVFDAPWKDKRPDYFWPGSAYTGLFNDTGEPREATIEILRRLP